MLHRDDWWKSAAYTAAVGFGSITLGAGVMLGATLLIWVGVGFLAVSVFCALQAVGQIIDGRPRDVQEHQAAIKSLRICLDDAAKISRLNPQHENAKAECDKTYKEWEWSVHATLVTYREDEIAAFKAASLDTTGNPTRKGIAIKRWGWTLDRLDGQTEEIGEIIKRAQARLTWAK